MPSAGTRAAWTDTDPRVLRVAVLTRGSPAAVTGGHLYHQRMAEAAPRHDAAITFSQTRLGRGMPGDADVVVIDSLAAWRLAPSLVMRRRSRPLVAMVHQQPGGVDTAPLRYRLQRATDRFVYRRCDRVLTASRSLAEVLIAEHRVDPARVRLVEPGCDLPPVTGTTDLRRGRRIALVCVANWYPNKGVLELLDAVATVPASDATLHLAGRDDVDADYGARVRRRLAAPDLAGRVVVHGAIDRETVAQLYHGADVFVFPSFVEGYATAAAEALWAGLPVVGWRRPHLERLTADGVEGRLIEPGDVAALGAVLARMATDDDDRRRLAAGARRRGSTLPTWNDAATAFFAALRGAAAVAVEPADDGSSGLDVDSTDAGVLDEHPPHDLVRHAERPGQRRLDRADVCDDDDD